MTVKLQNVRDAKIVMQQAAARYAECEADYEEQACAYLAEKWDCHKGRQVRHTRTNKIGIVESIMLHTIHSFEPDIDSRPWIEVRTLKKDGEPGGHVREWFDDWVPA